MNKTKKAIKKLEISSAISVCGIVLFLFALIQCVDSFFNMDNYSNLYTFVCFAWLVLSLVFYAVAHFGAQKGTGVLMVPLALFFLPLGGLVAESAMSFITYIQTTANMFATPQKVLAFISQIVIFVALASALLTGVMYFLTRLGVVSSGTLYQKIAWISAFIGLAAFLVNFFAYKGLAMDEDGIYIHFFNRVILLIYAVVHILVSGNLAREKD